MANRDRNEITIKISKIATSGKKKTGIIRDAGQIIFTVKTIPRRVVAKRTAQNRIETVFRTTEKGLEFLEKCRECPLFKWDKGKIQENAWMIREALW